MPDIRVQDETGTVHVFPDGSTPEMIANALGVKPPSAPQADQSPNNFAGPTTTGTATAAPGGVKGWLQSLEGDVRYGGTTTAIGKALHALGATGINRGVSEGAVEQGPGSLIAGPIAAAQGVADIPDHPVQGSLKALGGAMQTLNIPLAFAGAAPGNAESVMGKVIPSVAKEQASASYSNLMNVLKDHPVQTTDGLSGALSRFQELVDTGTVNKTPVSKLIKRLVDPEKGPITYKEAQDFYSNLTDLSANLKMNLNDKAKAAIGAVTRELGKSIGITADTEGMGEIYNQTRAQYAYGAQGTKAINKAIKYGAGAVGGGVAGGALANYLAKSH